MSAPSKAQVVNAIKAINESLPGAEASLIDWTDVGDGYAILTEDGHYDAVEISFNATVHGALPKGTYLEPINNASLRLVRA